MAKKLPGGESKWQKNVPGPGNYEYMSLTNQNSQKSISKYISAQSNKFGKSKRPSLAHKSIAPGPGQRNLFLI